MTIVILLLGFAFLAYFQPKFALGVILALLPTYMFRWQMQGVPTTFLELLLLTYFAVTFLKHFADLHELKKLGRINWLILLFVAAGIISTLVSPDKRSALGILKAFIVEPVMLFYAVRLTIKRAEDLTTPLNLLFIGAILVSLFGIFQYVTYIRLPLKFWGTGDEVERIVSFFDYPNALALYLGPLVSFFLAGFLFDEKILNRKNLAAGLVVMLIALFLTFSRGAWLGVALTATILVFLKYPFKKVLAFVAILAILGLAVPQIRSRLGLAAHDASSSARVNLMLAGYEKIQDSPILGNGLSGFPTTLAKQHFQGEILNYPHNIFFNFWVEMGLLGLISFFGIIFVSAKRYDTHRTWYTTAAVAYMFTLILHGLVDVPYFKNDLSILFWFMISVFYI
ncbi:MAG: O-antigen ligase family protein [Candidatus Doudnabacteria bacterium]|nr:O-antigen ligase family protein [Candidatus Doudnabacteria bacterium]